MKCTLNDIEDRAPSEGVELTRAEKRRQRADRRTRLVPPTAVTGDSPGNEFLEMSQPAIAANQTQTSTNRSSLGGRS